ncbi:uncharacterized protein N7525_001608 [Penicillium rubens]|uniref:uncharacterized protein n=1 Tax=Penicillium rubens TaxID=1108849 RepID=UPI002A5AF4DE|nr:uncharacterized protein N7525_001608 [Penicillium rubens]KAJ5843867.1 hypothetical protein N7525_001608 [Penicillium rubens]KAJ5845545.1 hypothetical protein N7534_009214 [Penicillium rubens]
MHQISGTGNLQGCAGRSRRWGRRDIHQAMKGTSKSKQDANFGLLAVPFPLEFWNYIACKTYPNVQALKPAFRWVC